MPDDVEVAARKPAHNYRDPNDKIFKAAESRKRASDRYANAEAVDETKEKTRHSDGKRALAPTPPDIETPGGSEQPGYRMKRARFWQS